MKRLLCLVAVVTLLSITTAAWAATPVRLWDTGKPLRGQADVAKRATWRATTAGAKLKGDLVVESGTLAAAFASKLGKVLVSSTADPAARKAEIAPTEVLGKKATLVANAAAPEGAVAVHTEFRAGATHAMLVLSFSRDSILQIAPQGSTRGVGISAPVELALVPSFVGDDLILDPHAYPRAKSLAIPSEHVLLGLLKGENSELVMTWQEDIPSVRLAANGNAGTLSFIGGKGLFLSVLEAPRLWHRLALKPDYLERDIAIGWKPPFPAIWLTQLYEDEVKTTFDFRGHREDTWRGGVGNYIYPTWFSRGKTMLTLGKKIPPEGEAIIYCLERNEETPPSAMTPIDVVQRTLTGNVLARILDVEGRPTWYPHREPYVIGGATCGVTDAFLKIFGDGQEVAKKDMVEGGVEDMYAYLTGMFERNARFYPFSQSMVAYLTAQEKANPKLAPWLREMRATAAEIGSTYDGARDTFRDINYAHELGAKTIALTAEKRPDNLQRMIELKQDWTGMGGSLEELARREHTLTRRLYQQAGYGVATRPAGMSIAEEVRKRTRQCLERAESYEIWANY